MSREIKFRAWDVSNKRMYSHEQLLDGREVNPDVLTDCLIADGTGYDTDTVLLQYTGLKDKNGTEIYEGDIVKTTKPRKGYIAEEFTGRVYWLDGQFQWWITDDKPPNGVDYDLSYLGYFENFEVIGNIYEAPGLLKSDTLPSEHKTSQKASSR